MTLKDYLNRNNLTRAGFARSLGVTPTTVRNWNAGRRMPRGAHMIGIVAATGGMVTPNDFLPPSAWESAD
jgi:DNA-binding transcriptional regulator YiaG